MKIIPGIAGILLILIILVDVFETIVLPRAIRRTFRLARLFYQSTWRPFRYLAGRLSNRPRELLLGVYGPLSLIMLLAIWMAGMIIGFAAVQWAFGGTHATSGEPRTGADFPTTVYFSGTTLLTLGLGDFAPRTGAARALTVLEVAAGFGVLALVIGYLPVLYQAFSRREISVSLLDSRAGSPPTAGELLVRHVQPDNIPSVQLFLREWERWAAELMEGHLSFPVLAYYRSQHENQSWLAALTSILDACAFVLAYVDEPLDRAARLAFATARHAVVDLARVFHLEPVVAASPRLSPEELTRLLETLAEHGVRLRANPDPYKLTKMRSMYEPYALALSEYLLLPLPPWGPTESSREYWRSIGGH